MALTKQFLAEWLYMDKDDALPVGAPGVSGFIGFLESARMYKVHLPESVAEEAQKSGEWVKPDIMRTNKTGSFSLYYKESLAAQSVQKLVGTLNQSKSFPNYMHLFRMPTSKVLNRDQAKLQEGFGDSVFSEAAVVGYRSKRWWTYHMLTIPSIVHAMAVAFDYKVPGFDLSPLNNPIVNDEFQFNMFGHPDVSPEENMKSSFFGKQRTELWAALGETDPLKWTIGVERSSFNTVAPKLVDCIHPVQHPWRKGTWAKLSLVASPIVGDGFESKDEEGFRQSQVPVIQVIYQTESEAKVAGEAEKKSDETGEVVAVSSNGVPAIPEAWKDIAEDWIKTVQEYAGLTKVVFYKKWDEASIGATKEEGWVWAEYLKSQK